MGPTRIDSATTYTKAAKCFDVALRSLRLYPPEHVICREALSALQIEIVDILAQDSSFTIACRKRGVAVNSEAMDSTQRWSKSLAKTMRERGVVEIRLDVGFQKSELYETLGALCMDPNELRAQGGIAAYLKVHGVDHITIRENVLAVVDADAAVTLRPNTTTSLSMEAASIVATLNNADPQAAERRALLLSLSHDKVHLAELLQKVAGSGLQEESVNADDAPDLFKLIPKICSVFAQELPDDRHFLLNNLAEAIMLLPENLRNKVLSKIVLAANEDDTPLSLIPFIKDDEIGRLVNKLRASEGLSLQQTSDLLGKLPLDSSRLQRIASLIDEASETQEQQARLTSLLNSRETKNRADKDRDDLPAPPEVGELVDDIDPNPDPRLDSFVGENLLHLKETLAEHAFTAVIGLLEEARDKTARAQFASTLSRLFYKSLSEGLPGPAALVVRKVQSILTCLPGSAEEISFAQAILRQAGDPGQISRLIASGPWPRGVVPAPVTDYFQALGPTGVNGLLAALGSEETAKQRQRICLLLRQLGEPALDQLVAKLSDNRWYLVRNVVMVLGAIGCPEAVPPLRQVARHPDARVRFQVAQAAAAIGSSVVEPILTLLIRDADGRVRKSAAQALLRTGGALHLASILASRDPLGRNYKVKLDICQVLSECPAEQLSRADVLCEALGKLKVRVPIFFRWRQRALAAAADSALKRASNYQAAKERQTR